MILIKNGTLVDAFGASKSDLLTDGSRISEIRRGIKERVEKTIDASGRIVIPGLVNMHSHLPMSLLRNTAEGKPLGRWLREEIFPIEGKMRDRDMYIGSYFSIAESLLSGTTATNSMYPGGSHLAGKAADELNARVFLGCDELREGADDELKVALRFNEKTKKYRMARPVMASHSIYACKKENLAAKKEYAREKGLAYDIHMSETRREVFDSIRESGMRPVEYADSIGLLDERTVLAHASWVTKREIGIVAKRKATVVNCPASNLKLATGGIMPLEQYREAGARITLGTDGPASNNSLSMLETMKLASLLQKHRYWDASVGSPREILGYATHVGANALGLKAGRIAKGYLADLVVIDPGIGMVPLGDIYTSLVFSCSPSNVEHVIVDGRVSVENRKIVNFDGKKKREFERAAERLRS